MAAPNVLGLSTVTSASALVSITATATPGTAVLTNAAASGKVYRVCSLYLNNITSSNVTASLYYKDASGTNTETLILNAIFIPANTSLVAIDKYSPVNMEEGDVITATCSVNAAINVLVSYDSMG